MKLESLMNSFRHRHRDFVFLVNQSDYADDIDACMSNKMLTVQKTLLKILNNENGAIESKDRISLIKFAKGLRRIFTLVEKEKNFIQLKNQVETLKVDDDQYAQLAKALKQTTFEFVRGRGTQLNETMDIQGTTNASISNHYSVMPSRLMMNSTIGAGMPMDIENGTGNKRWVICFTNSIESQEKSSVTLEMAADAYLKNQINVVLICYDLSKEDIKLAQWFTK